jgi:tetratricopeptide (TPR) repeat protein
LLWATQDKASRSDPENALYQNFDKVVEQIIKGFSSRSDSTWAFPVMEAYLFRGQALYARGEFREALTNYDQALQVYEEGNPVLLSPERAMTLYGLKGDAFMQLRDYVSAGQAYGEALKMAQTLNNPTSASSYEARQKQADEALRATAVPDAVATVEQTQES